MCLETAENLLESRGWSVMQHMGQQTRFWKHHTFDNNPTRWAHEVTACIFYLALEKAHQPGRVVHSSAGNSTDVQVMVPCPAAAVHYTRVCAICSGWQVSAVHPVNDEACTLVFHFWPLCRVYISSPPWYYASVPFAGVSRIPESTLYSEEDESSVFKPTNRSSIDRLYYHFYTETVPPSSDHYCIDIVVSSSDHFYTETVPPSSDRYCTKKVAPPSDNIHLNEPNNLN